MWLKVTKKQHKGRAVAPTGEGQIHCGLSTKKTWSAVVLMSQRPRCTQEFVQRSSEERV